MQTLCFGEIMLRLSPSGAQRFVQAQQFEAVFGGSEANVAVSLAQFGVPVAYLTRVPDSELGCAALDAVARFGVKTEFSVRGGERLGLYFLEQGVGRRASKVIYDRAGSGMATLAPGMIDWHAALERTSWLHWSGITPALSQSAADALLEGLKTARERGIRISCDLNFRANLWKYGKTSAEVMPPLVALTDVLLGDETSFGICLRSNISDNADAGILLEAVKAAFPHLKHLAMTRREGFSASHNSYQGLLYDGQKLFFSKKYDLPDILDRIGTGDAFMAGLILGLQKNEADLQETVEFATAAAALKHYIAGDFNLCSEAEVRALMTGDSGGRIRR
ncbi:MAG: sugar kinase [Saprospiraceae bacterium]